MRCWWMVLVLACACAAWSDRIDAGVYWPGWRMQAGEDMVSPRYPLTNLVDGRMDTAWVFNKALHAHRESEPAPFNHGTGKAIRIDLRAGSSVTLDGIGITNGYVKDGPTYWRNNRIRKITLSLWDGKEITHSFTLRDARTLQRFTFPRVTVRQMVLRVEAVDPGRDDDLCISELVFYRNGRLLDWKLTPFVFTNDSNQSCCGGTDFALRTQGGLRLSGPDGALLTVAAFACQPGHPIALLGSRTELYLFDLQRGAYLYQRDISAPPAALGWLNTDTAAVALFPDHEHQDWEHLTWFRLRIGNPLTWETTPPPAKSEPFLPGVEGPWYPA